MEWPEGLAKLFMSHIHAHRDFVAEVQVELADRGVGAFVAHNDIAPTHAWQEAIEEALQTCEATAAFLHHGFKESDWTDQEMGYCIARGVLVIPLRFDLTPYGFMGRWQAAPCVGKTPAQIADIVHLAMLHDPRTQDSTEDGLLYVLGQSTSFDEANRRAGYLTRVKNWNSAPKLRALERCLQNDQVQRGWKAKKVIQGILKEHPVEDAAPF